jgi:pheromone shutdown protein TraB
MHKTAIFVSIFVAIFVAIFLPLVPLLGERWRAAENKARARRIADAKMNARLLRLNL